VYAPDSGVITIFPEAGIAFAVVNWMIWETVEVAGAEVEIKSLTYESVPACAGKAYNAIAPQKSEKAKARMD
jgi:hypothetical protein